MDLDALRSEANTFVLDRSDWYNYWHKHVDWEGEGNCDPIVRRACLEALVTMMTRARAQLLAGGPFQVWLRVDESDSGQDAFYVHTPNPHSEFPFDFSEVSWGEELPEALCGTIDPAEFRIGRSDWEGYRTFWLCPLE